MLIFDKCINYAATNYLGPLSEFGVSFPHLRQDAVKTMLTKDAPIRIESSNASEAVFYYQKNTLLKAINNDAMLFFIRAMLQGDTVKRMTANYSTNWCLVSDYYYGFYLSGLLLRLCLRGTVYLDDKTKRDIQRVITAHSGRVSAIGNNCFFIANIDDKACEYKLTLTSSSNLRTHELVWTQVDHLLLLLEKTCSENSDEQTVLKSIEQINNAIGCTYPAKLRNKLNYHPYYSVREVNKEYSRPVNSVDWLDPILFFDRHYEDRDQSNINLVTSYIYYLQQLTFCLLNKYDSMRGRASGILSSINKYKEEKIVLPTVSFTYR